MMKNAACVFKLGLFTLLLLVSRNIFSQTCGTTISSYPYSEGFESGLGAWSNVTGDTFDWTRDSAGTPSGSTGPSTGDSSSYYMFTEASSPRNTGDIANFESPCFNLTGLANPQFSYSYHMYGSNMGTLNILISTDNGATYPTTLKTYSGDLGNTWFQDSIDLSAYSGSTVKIRIQGIRGSGYRSDMAIDNVAMMNVTPAPEINVQGNSTDIVDGDTTPSTTDYTNFTTGNIGVLITRTFTIENNGSGSLTISSISLSNTTDFSIVGTPYSSPVSSGSSTTFTVQFNSLTLGTKTSTVTINNDDADESSYQFTIEARAEQNFFDSDGDGVYDNIDIDDDNDGILDSDEELACQSSSISTTMNYKFLNETFGTGNRTTINTTYDATTTYCYEDGTNGTNTADCPDLYRDDLNDGEYTVYYTAGDGDGTDDTPVDEVASWADAYWYTGNDHTSGDTNGRMAMFNASYDPGTFYTATITGSLPNIPITYSFWVLNLDTTNAPGIATRLRPDILVEFRDVNNNVLASITTGDIPPSINGDAENSWHNFTANLTLNVSEFYVYFINNEVGGAGNDLAIDDIVISQTLCDTDNDGIADLFDLDADNDGIPDVVEAGLGAHSEGKATLTGIGAWVDANANGMHDLIESNTVLDSDGDGTPNFLDLDSDNDSIFDVDESGAGNTADTSYQNGDGDINGDGVGDGSDTDTFRETDVDSDGTTEYYADGILDLYDYFNGSSYATGYGNSNQGLGNTYYVLDSDSDGNPDYMDVTSDGTTYDISHTLYASLDANNDGVIDDTNDSDNDGIVDLFDTDDTIFGSPRDIDQKLHLYFDGRNDYIEDTTVMSTWGEVTQMCWIKIDPSISGASKTIMGQDNFYITLNSDLSISATANGTTVTNGSALATNRWIHVGATYSNSNKEFKLYINGKEVDDEAVSGNLASDTTPYTLGRNPNTNSGYFMGYIDEAKVFDVALTASEFQKNVYQEIEDNTLVRGAIIPKDITTLSWNNVERYFRFDTYKDDIADDYSTATVDVGSGAKMYNFKVIDYQNAPLPFVTQSSGPLDSAVNISADGVYGTDAATYDWSIVRVEHDDVTYNSDQKHLGLIINELDASSNPIEFSVQNDSELNVSWYLKLDGLIDLEGESQLVQGAESTLDVTSKGAIERDQQGTADLFTYNYWAAPVGETSASSNNNNYKLTDILKDGTNPSSPATITWLTSGYNGSAGPPIEIADYWIWKYANQTSDDYPSWQHVRSTGTLQPGEGYTMKGTTDTGGVITNEQNYVFNGKPHNGDITLTLSAGNDYLIGNPYASAIDANEFILDNISDGAGRATTNIIDGALYFWDHFAGSTHNLGEYQGGYATYTLLGGTVAISNDVRIDNSGAIGSKEPEQYIPVGQGFFVTADAGGTITFKNSQRIFKTEASDPSIFMRANNGKNKESNSANSQNETAIEDIRPKIRLMFDSPKGYHRQLLVGADENTTSLFDRGYDAPLIESNNEDMFWIFNEKNYIIQAVNNFNDSNVFPIGVKISEQGEASFKIDRLENIPSSLDIFVYDKTLNTFNDLNLMTFKTNLEPGEYLDRFELIFYNTSLTVNESELKTMNIFYSNSEKSIIIENPLYTNIKAVYMINMLGQEVFSSEAIQSQSKLVLKPKELSSGAYIIKVSTDKGTATQKVIVD